MVTLALALDQPNGLYHSLYRLCHRYPVFIVQHRNDCPADERSHLICDDLGHRHVQRLLSCIEQSVPDLSRVWHAISDRWEEKEMKVLQSLALLFFLCWIGDVVSTYLPIPIPGSVISMALLLLLLLLGVLKQRQVQPVGDYLLENMGILFLPSLVMVMDVWPLLQMYLFEIVFIGIVVTIVTFTVTALSLKALMAWQRKRKEARHDSPS